MGTHPRFRFPLSRAHGASYRLVAWPKELIIDIKLLSPALAPSGYVADDSPPPYGVDPGCFDEYLCNERVYLESGHNGLTYAARLSVAEGHTAFNRMARRPQLDQQGFLGMHTA